MSSIDALENWSRLSDSQRLLILRQEKVRRVSTRRFDLFYPDTGPLRRELYQKQLEFFRAGAKYRERPTCRYIFGDVRKGRGRSAWRFCKRLALPGLAWCETHRRVVYETRRVPCPVR